MSKKLILIDGNSLFNRAFFALPLLMNKKGFYTNAIYGFASMTNNVIDTYKPDYMAVAFDLKGPTFRHAQFGDYKAGRKGMPEELVMQVEPLKQMVEAMGIAKVEFPGYEADDIIGTLSKFGEAEDLEVIIVTGDKDALQLASQKTKILITKKGISETEEYDNNTVFERYGLTPTEFIDLKALMGDKSDNIKGVAGIGEKTGMKLLQEYRSIENLYENIENIKGSVKTKLENDRESAFLSKKLATIIRDMPIELDLDELKYKGAKTEALMALYREFEMTSLLNKVAKQAAQNGEEAGKSASLSNESANGQLQFGAAENIQGEPTANVHNNPATGMTVKISASSREEVSLRIAGEYDVTVFEVKDRTILLLADIEKKSTRSEYIIYTAYVQIEDILYEVPEAEIQTLKAMLEEASNKIVSHDIKTFYKAFLGYGIDIANLYFDVEIAEYVIDANSGKYTLEDINNKYGLDIYEDLEAILGKGKAKISTEFADKDRMRTYYKNALATIASVYPEMERTILAEGLGEVFYDIEMPLTKVLAGMEMEGFTLNKQLLDEFSVEFTSQIKEFESEIYALAGEEFNINSPKQLGVILFEKLGLPTGKKTKTGYSTNIEVLEYLKDKHPIIEKIMEYRQIAKLKSTYIDGLTNILDPETGKVYTTFSQTTASTGRLSSLDPNLQNIPIRTERGRKLRGLFIAEGDNLLIDADYSQIELRILAHLADDPGMIQAFEDHVDIHTKTASEVFDVPIEDVTSEMRSAAKAVNFGIVYGISDFGLSNNLGITMGEAKIYIEKYLDRYQDVKAYLSDIVEEVKETGYSTTIFGRRRYIPELQAKNAMVRGFGKRLAMNTPIQGAAADIIKIAMIEVDRHLKENYKNAKLLLQVHDELIVQAEPKDVEKLKPEIIEIMENAAQLRVKLEVEAKSGKSWYETK